MDRDEILLIVQQLRKPEPDPPVWWKWLLLIGVTLLGLAFLIGRT